MLPSHVKEALGESAAIIALSSFANFVGLLIAVNLPNLPNSLTLKELERRRPGLQK
jgi:hypothetical protein